MTELRKVTESETLQLQEVCRMAYTQVFSSHWNENGMELYLEREFNANRLSKELNDPNYDYFFIVHAASIVGFIKVNYTSSPELSALENCELDKIYILPAHSGKGIGKAAMSQVIEKARRRSKELFFLCVIDTNKSAIGFYQRLGFTLHSKTSLEVPHFKEELKGMERMCLELG